MAVRAPLQVPSLIADALVGTVGRVLVGPMQQQQVFVTPPTQPHGSAGPGLAYAEAREQQQVGRGAAAAGYRVIFTQADGGCFLSPVPLPQLPEPSPEAVQQLVAMGFDAARAAQALQHSGGDVQAAIQFLV